MLLPALLARIQASDMHAIVQHLLHALHSCSSPSQPILSAEE